jgi:hypothetical protein
VQSLFDHYQPRSDPQLESGDQPLCRQPRADAGSVSGLSGSGGAQHRRRARVEHDAVGHAAATAHRRAARHQHPQHVIAALAHLTAHDVSEIDLEVRAALTEIGTS